MSRVADHLPVTRSRSRHTYPNVATAAVVSAVVPKAAMLRRPLEYGQDRSSTGGHHEDGLGLVEGAGGSTATSRSRDASPVDFESRSVAC